MQELEEAERYSAAALFTLALHSTASQADNGGEGWGEPEDARDSVIDPSSDEPDPFWGRDLVLPGGLLDAVYFQLGLPPFKWAGLKALPIVAPSSDSSAFRSAVRSLIAVLDQDLLASLPAPAPARRRKGEGEASPRAGRLNVPDELWDGLLSSSDDDDEELERDTQWERQLEEQQRERERRRHRQGPSEDDIWTSTDSPLTREAIKTLQELQELSSPKSRHHQQGNHEGSLFKQRSEEYAALVKQMEELSAANEKVVVRTIDTEQGNDAKGEGEGSIAAGATTSTSANENKNKKKKKTSRDDYVSPLAVAALWELLQCCIGASVAACEAANAAVEAEADAQRGGHDPASPKFFRRQGTPPCVRYYDARARVALGLVGVWLQVPQRKLATLEVLLGSDKAPTTARHRSGNDNNSSADKYRYLKVGLAALGGGALFAVTGGLAAPAIAAGVGSILGIVPGASAAAGAVAGFMSTQVGVAAVTTTMATAGAATTGSKMAYRTAEVKDFGFLELKETMATAAITNNNSSSTSPEKVRGVGDRGYSSTITRERSSSFTSSLDMHKSWSDSGIGRDDSTNAGAAGGGADPGHLLGGNGSGSLSIQGRRHSGSLSSLNSSNKEAGPSSSSAWKSWFGKSKNTDSADDKNGNTTSTSNKDDKDSNKIKEKLLPVPIRPSHPAEGIKLSTVIGVSGWITNPEDFINPWTCVTSPAADRFALVWCTSELQTLQSALGALLAKGAAGQAARLGMQHLLIGGAGLVSALGPTVILGAATGLLIENAWTVAIDRSDKAGKLLAHVLMTGGNGGRPVTLIAHSMGARLVFSALLELCRCEARGLVQDVVLLGAPVPPTAERWKMARRVVAGRFVNGYSRGDWLLNVMFWQGIAKPAAGLAPVEVDGVENVSLSSVVNGHFDYIGRLDEILELLQVSTTIMAGG